MAAKGWEEGMVMGEVFRSQEPGARRGGMEHYGAGYVVRARIGADGMLAGRVVLTVHDLSGGRIHHGDTEAQRSE